MSGGRGDRESVPAPFPDAAAFCMSTGVFWPLETKDASAEALREVVKKNGYLGAVWTSVDKPGPACFPGLSWELPHPLLEGRAHPMRRDDAATPPPGGAGDGAPVTVTLVTICGHTCPFDITEAERNGDVGSLLRRAASAASIHPHRVRLLYKGKRVAPDDAPVDVKNPCVRVRDLPYGAKILCIAYPPPTTNSIKGAADGGDDLDTWTWFAKNLWRTTPMHWRVAFVAWLAGGPMLTRLAPSVAPVYVIVSLIVVIFVNLGTKKEGEVSAYSCFNEGQRRLPGTFTADDVDQAVRRGQM